MPVIDPKGLFEGQRLAACSDRAQSYWPRLYCASNGYARLELHYPSIVSRCFHYYRETPSEDAFFAVVVEFADNFLVIPYKVHGQYWVQFATEEKYLRRRKTFDDEASPAPPPESLKTFVAGYAAWKEKKQAFRNQGDANISQMFPNYFGNTSDAFPSGSGSGFGSGVGSGSGEKPFAPSVEKPRSMPDAMTVFDLPLIGGKEYGVPQTLYDEYVNAFPGISVMAELAKLRSWLLSNPTKMKTLRGMPRFMNTWLSKAQDNQPHGRSNRYGNPPLGKADGNLAVLAASLERDQREDRAHQHGLLPAGEDRRTDARRLYPGSSAGRPPRLSGGDGHD